jgi:hypothetical protein
MRNSSMRIQATAVVACLLVGALCVSIHVRAQDQSHFVPVPQFGILGITRGQTARINVVNVSSPDNPFFPPDPCRVTMSFVDADGNVLLNNAGHPVRREVTLEPGHAAFLQINGDTLVPRDQLRLTFRPVVTVMPSDPNSPPDPNIPPDPCFPTLEVISNTTGHTSLLSNGIAPIPAQTSATGQ